jgi:hypothetical protein
VIVTVSSCDDGLTVTVDDDGNFQPDVMDNLVRHARELYSGVCQDATDDDRSP